jgi:ABC-type lipoprotein release transport system permease subunit
MSKFGNARRLIQQGWYLLATSVRDTFRARGTLVMSVFIIAAICLPSLMLLGFKRGLVAQFRDDILKNADARQIETWATQQGEAQKFSRRQEQHLMQTVPGIALIIPDIHGTAWLASQGVEAEVNLNCTRPGDPFLEFYGADRLKAGDRGIVISRDLADRLKVAYRKSGKHGYTVSKGQKLSLQVRRSGAGGREEVQVAVRDVFSKDDEYGRPLKLATAYLEFQMMDWLEDFKKGRSVPELALKGSTEPPRPVYDGYLSFRKEPMTASDERRLKLRGLKPVPLAAALGDEEAEACRRLYGLLRRHELYVDWIGVDFGSPAQGTPVDLAPTDVEDITESDDVILAWSPPRRIEIFGEPHVLVGATLNGRRWLRNEFYNEYARMTGAGAMRVKFPDQHPGEKGPELISLSLGETGPILQLAVEPAFAEESPPELSWSWKELKRLLSTLDDNLVLRLPDSPTIGEFVREAKAWFGSEMPSPRVKVAVIPSELAAHLARAEDGVLEFDPLLNQFVPASAENEYTKALIYAADLNDVPAAASALGGMGYNTASERTSVEEMQGYVRTLDILVYSVLAATLLFGCVTVCFVYWELTTRKRGAIGVMRLIGMPRWAVGFFVITRALVVGVLGTLCTLVFGAGLAWLLASLGGVACDIDWSDRLSILAGALGCSALGVIWPALLAAKLDPVDAILASKIQ